MSTLNQHVSEALSVLYIPRFKSVTYGMNSKTNAAIYSWNKLTEIADEPF